MARAVDSALDKPSKTPPLIHDSTNSKTHAGPLPATPVAASTWSSLTSTTIPTDLKTALTLSI